VLAASEYTFAIAGRFLSYKMIARDLLGCTGRWGFCAIYKHFSGFRFSLLPNSFSARPSASNANRWAFLGAKEKALD